jgi:hypothetical protein
MSQKARQAKRRRNQENAAKHHKPQANKRKLQRKRYEAARGIQPQTQNAPDLTKGDSDV